MMIFNTTTPDSAQLLVTEDPWEQLPAKGGLEGRDVVMMMDGDIPA